jgi:hypothetical protein
MAFNREKTPFRDGHHRMHERVARLCALGLSIAFAIAMVVTSQAFALPYCPNGNWQNDQFICVPE